LDERFNSTCVAYAKAVLSEVLKEAFAKLYSSELLPAFSRIRIKDSTKFIVPAQFEGKYKSCGGDLNSKSKAAVSIQYEYDLKSGEITDLNITSGNRNDRIDAGETADNMEKDDLIIRDLGYFSTLVLASCLQKEAFFLSRVDTSTNKITHTHDLAISAPRGVCQAYPGQNKEEQRTGARSIDGRNQNQELV
jgi:hypothetical protein